MDRETEIALIRRCKEQQQANATTLGPAETRSDVDRYLCEDRFQRELALIHRRYPVPYVHGSQLAAPNSFRRVDTSLGNVLFTRDEHGRAHAFHNVCRHRGAALTDVDSGSARRLTCPYHAWSYTSDGALAGVPGQDRCFPSLNKAERGLKAIPSTEAYGFIWLCPQAESDEEAAGVLAQHLGDMATDMAWLDMASLQVFDRSTRNWQANWKLLSEGGLETYHFKAAHRDTIGPYFLNNISVRDNLGNGHFRVVMPSQKIAQSLEQADDALRLRDFTHTLFTVAPQVSFLAQENHVDWIRITPISVNETEISITSLVPVSEGSLTEEERRHWDTNLRITLTTLDEDFELGESIQAGLASGANDSLLFGLNENSLDELNGWIEAVLAAG